MFRLVADVERYPEFVPLCQSLTVRQRHPDPDNPDCEIVLADMTVAYKLLRETFTSRVLLDPKAMKIHVAYVDGPFRQLDNRWSFQPVGETRCDVDFELAYEFRSAMFEKVMGAVFDRAFAKFSDAFERRADAVYGRRRATV